MEYGVIERGGERSGRNLAIKKTASQCRSQKKTTSQSSSKIGRAVRGCTAVLGARSEDVEGGRDGV